MYIIINSVFQKIYNISIIRYRLCLSSSCILVCKLKGFFTSVNTFIDPTLFFSCIYSGYVNLSNYSNCIRYYPCFSLGTAHSSQA